MSRSLARKLNSPATLPGRLLRELRWLWRDLKDLHAELTRYGDQGRTAHPYQSEMTDKDIAHDGY